MILELLDERGGQATIKEIAEDLNISEMTARRDVSKLEQSGLVSRFFGGVSLNRGILIEQALPIRNQNLSAEKKIIGQKALEYVNDGDTICVGTGTTLNHFAKQLAGKNVTVVTTSIFTSMSLGDSGLTVYLAGGKINYQHMYTYGEGAINFYRTMNFDTAFISAAGFSLEGGISEYTEESALIKRTMVEQSKKVVILVDHTKFSRERPFRSIEIEDVDVVITDKMPDSQYLEIFEKNKIELVVVEP